MEFQVIISDNLGYCLQVNLESGNLYPLRDRDLLSQQMATVIMNFDSYKENNYWIKNCLKANIILRRSMLVLR